MASYVYLIQNGDLFNIGSTNNLERTRIDLNNRVPREAQGAQTLRLAGTFDQREERREEREERQERRDDGRRDDGRRGEERRDGRR